MVLSGRCALREALSLKCFCAVLVAICGLILPAVPLAHAGKGKPNVVRTASHHVKGGRVSHIRFHSRSGRGYFKQTGRGYFKQKRFHKRSKHSGYAKRRDRKRHHRKRRYSHGSIYYYGYGRDDRYRDYPRYEPIYRSETRPAVQPYSARPVTPKWVHVGSTGGALGSYTAEAPNAESGIRRNCLSVKTEITVDGNPVDAFGDACLLADGTWEFRPLERND